ncbi:MAG: hypothetical protein HY325_06795 [Chloroflexi bacterium]|nr:hypothetical protein [Chloroflexota bacterium]
MRPGKDDCSHANTHAYACAHANGTHPGASTTNTHSSTSIRPDPSTNTNTYTYSCAHANSIRDNLLPGPRETVD